VKDLYEFLTRIDKNLVEAHVKSISSQSDAQQYDLVQRAEKLYMRLMIEYNQELHRAHSLGLFKRNVNSSGLQPSTPKQDVPEGVSRFDAETTQ
jgi:hypothetical protein